MSHSHVISQIILFSTLVTGSFHVTNIQYIFTMYSHVKNVWYSELMSHCHAMTYHKRLIFSTHVTQTCHVLSQMSVIQYSCHKLIHATKLCYSVLMLHSHTMSRHKCLIFSNYITQSCHVTNFWYSFVISYRYVMPCQKCLLYSTHVKLSIHVTNAR